MASTHSHTLEQEGIIPQSQTLYQYTKTEMPNSQLQVKKSGGVTAKLRQTLNTFQSTAGGGHKRTNSQPFFPKVNKSSNFTDMYNQDRDQKDPSMNSTHYGTAGAGITGTNFMRTGLKRRTNSITNLAQTLSVNHPDSRFMYTISKTDKNLNNFVNSGNSLVEKEVVSGISNRYKFWEGNSGQLINKAVKRQMNYLKDDKALDLLQDAMEQSNIRDLKIMEDKLKSMINELNRSSASIQALQSTKITLENTAHHLEAETQVIFNDGSKVIGELAVEMNNMEKRVGHHQNRKGRMDKIIDICKINMIQNEDWLRGLEKYMSNLNHSIDLQAKTNESLEKERGKIEVASRLVKQDFNTNVQNHKSVIDDISHALEDFRQLKNNIYDTNSYVQSVVHDRNQEISDVLITNKKKKDNENLKKEYQRRKDDLIEKLKAAKEEHTQYAKIFEPGQDGQPWNEKQQVIKMVENLENHKEIKIAIMQKRSQVDLINSENEVLQSKVDV